MRKGVGAGCGVGLQERVEYRITDTKIKSAIAALLAIGTVAVTASPASADRYWGGRGGYYSNGYYGGRGYGGDAVLGAGLAGLALGAALSGQHYGYGYGPRYGYDPRYGYGYGYAPAYPGYGYGTCSVRRDVWDPYYGGYVVRRVPVPC